MQSNRLYFAPLLLFILMYAQFTHAGLLDRWKKKREQNQPQAKVVKDIEFGPNKRQTLDVYIPEIKSVHGYPVHIYIHGGAWQMGDKRRYDEMGNFYADKGIIFIAVNYRLSPEFIHPAQVEDCASAINWAYKNIHKYGGNQNKLFLSGHSAGAHLVALVATDPKYLNKYGLRPTILNAVMPVDTASFDFMLRIKKGARLVQPMIDETFGTDPEGLKDASPITHARNYANHPNFVLFVTGKRQDAVIQTRNFHNALKGSGASSEMHVIENHSHKDMAYAMFDPDSSVSKTMLGVIYE